VGRADLPMAVGCVAVEKALGWPWNSLVALKKSVGRLSYSVIRLHPVADKIAHFCACFR
jgi:hypothetical protein